MNDRRRNNGPTVATTPPVFAASATEATQRPTRSRPANKLRKIFLQTGLVASASGSAYLELDSSPSQPSASLIRHTSSPKIICTVHGPKPQPRSAPFAPQLVLTSYVKFAPFATRHRRGFIRDNAERDLSAHLEAALRGIVIGERWPKNGAEVVVTVLEGEEDRWWGDAAAHSADSIGGWGMMTILAGCITAASAAIVEAGIDCVDLVTGGVAGLVVDAPAVQGQDARVVLDPCPAEHYDVLAACVVGHLKSRDELVELWMRGDAEGQAETLIDNAVTAASGARIVLADVLRESVETLATANASAEKGKAKQKQDQTMTG